MAGSNDDDSLLKKKKRAKPTARHKEKISQLEYSKS